VLWRGASQDGKIEEMRTRTSRLHGAPQRLQAGAQRGHMHAARKEPSTPKISRLGQCLTSSRRHTGADEAMDTCSAANTYPKRWHP